MSLSNTAKLESQIVSPSQTNVEHKKAAVLTCQMVHSPGLAQRRKLTLTEGKAQVQLRLQTRTTNQQTNQETPRQTQISSTQDYKTPKNSPFSSWPHTATACQKKSS